MGDPAGMKARTTRLDRDVGMDAHLPPFPPPMAEMGFPASVFIEAA